MADSATIDNLTTRQHKAVAALIVESSVRKAAESAGVPERTLYNWLKDATFAEAYRAAKRDAVGQAVSRLQHYSSAAATVLLEVMARNTTPPATRVMAAHGLRAGN